MEPQWGGEKVSRLQRKTTLSRIGCARSKQVGLNAETKKGVGIEPTGEIFLLTFTLIGRFCEAQSPLSQALKRWDSDLGQAARTRTFHGHFANWKIMRC